MKEKIKSFYKKHPRVIITIVAVAIFFTFLFLFFIVDQHQVSFYFYLILLLLFLTIFLFYVLKISREIFIPFAEPHIRKHGRLFTFFVLILPLWLSSFYLTFFMKPIDIFPSSIILIVRAFGVVSLVFSIIITSFWIKTDFSDKTHNTKNEDVDDNNILEVDEKFQPCKEELILLPSFKEYLIDPELWTQILKDERGKLYFLEDGTIRLNDLPNFEEITGEKGNRKIEKKEVAASLCRTLWKNKLFKKEYNNWKSICEISKNYFGIATTYTKEKKYANEKLFHWILKL